MKRQGRRLLFLAVLFLPAAASGGVFDHNGDGDVDQDDLQDFLACMAGPEVGVSAPCADAHDGDGDLDVDLRDYRLFQEIFTGPSSPITATQLAGNPLDEYPFFEYVKAFNEDSTVEVAIDPTRYPEIIGQTCDIHVVTAKTAGEWAVDPTLSDVTSGGLQIETFGGSTIQENTFPLTGPYELDADAGIGLGVGYDVVLDCDRDGELSDGDYIDGLGSEAGLYAVHDTTQPGPLAVTELSSYSVGTVFGIPAGYTNQNTFYPTGIDSMGELPLIVVSPGNGHYTWYDHIGFHMASYGYVVMSHQSNDAPGIESCSVTTLGHTDAFLDQLDTIGGGVLEGHVDSERIVWIGHSRGAEGVARAFDRIYDSDYTHGAVPPTNYGLDSIQLISSMLPLDFLKTPKSNPHHANYHLWTASGDADLTGSAGCDLCQTYHLHERATNYRMSTTVQGVGHGDFHNSSGSVFTGPCHIVPKSAVHDIMMGLFVPLIKHYVEGNVPATDCFWRQYERFHPIGVDISNPCIVVSNEYRNGAEYGNFFIDNYETETSTGTSSSGGSVTFTVTNLTEGRLDDNNSDFSWTASDPFNGATQDSSQSQDNGRGVVFDWDGTDRFYEWEVIAAARDFSDDLYLSFRGAQGTQHPNTLAVVGDVTFTVTLRDGGGVTSSINIGAYGGGFEQPYDRSGGWHNEMEVIRIRLTDFLHNGSGLDLTDTEAVRLNFGPSWGSNEGRIVIDELMLTNDHPALFVPLNMSLPDGAPELLPPGVPTVISTEINEGSDTLVPGSALLHYRYGGGTFLAEPLTQVSGTVWQATLPPPSCGDSAEFYFSAAGEITGVVYEPVGGPGSPFVASVGTQVIYLDDNFETDQDWTVEDTAVTDGSWERGVPADDGTEGDPLTDHDGSGQCYLTANRAGNSDLDGGPTRLISPTLDSSTASDPVLKYARWWANDDQDGDPFDVEVSNDNGASWVLIERVTNIEPGWIERTVRIADYIAPLTDTMKICFSAMDNPNNSKDEGGVDAVMVFEVECE